MSEEGVSIKAKNRIKKMTKLKILEKGQKLAKRQELAMVQSRKGHRQGGRPDSRGPRGGSRTSWSVATRVRPDSAQEPWPTGRSGTEASAEKPSVHGSFPGGGEAAPPPARGRGTRPDPETSLPRPGRPQEARVPECPHHWHVSE